MTIDRLTGCDVDDEFGLPKEYISCPGCGRTYMTARSVCRTCQECKRCCKNNPCEKPDYISARQMIAECFKENDD